MIRTRDFVLYVVVLIFILSGLAFTVLNQPSKTASGAVTVASLVASEHDPDAMIEPRLNREENLHRLREQIARGEGVISQGPPVFSSVDVPATASTASTENEVVIENQDALLETSDRQPIFCPVQSDTQAVVVNWPVTGADVLVREGARMVSFTKTSSVSTASGTVMSTTTYMALQLPTQPQRSLSSNCLDSDVVGITLNGKLIHNNETWRFRNSAPETLIGYARDGLPIYSQGVDETLLDSCGGYDTGAGYRYYVRESELFVLGCFAAPPVQFLK